MAPDSIPQNAPITPAELDMIEMSKLNDEINWLVAFVNRKLTEGSHFIMAGETYPVSFWFDDFMRSYSHLYYWRYCIEDIAALFREQGYVVVVTEQKARRADEQQPVLVFALAAQS